jgi:hypothetical protein
VSDIPSNLRILIQFDADAAARILFGGEDLLKPNKRVRY